MKSSALLTIAIPTNMEKRCSSALPIRSKMLWSKTGTLPIPLKLERVAKSILSSARAEDDPKRTENPLAQRLCLCDQRS